MGCTRLFGRRVAIRRFACGFAVLAFLAMHDDCTAAIPTNYTVVDSTPGGYTAAVGFGVGGGQQVGAVLVEPAQIDQAYLWTGTAAVQSAFTRTVTFNRWLPSP